MRNLVFVSIISVSVVAAVGCSSDTADHNAIESSMVPGSEAPNGGQSEDSWSDNCPDGCEQVEADYYFHMQTESPCDEEFRVYGSCSPYCDTSITGFTCSNVETAKPECCAHKGEAYDWYPAAGCRTHKPWLSEKVGMYLCQYRGENAPDDGCYGYSDDNCWEWGWDEEPSVVMFTNYFNPVLDDSFRRCSAELQAQVEAAPYCE